MPNTKRPSRSTWTRWSPPYQLPHLPENTHPASEGKDIRTFDQVVIGTCTNGRLEDMRGRLQHPQGPNTSPRVCAASSSRPPMAVYMECILTRAGPKPLLMRAASCPPPPAAPAWAATWAFWPRASAASPPPTATLWAAWAMSRARSIWLAPAAGRRQRRDRLYQPTPARS